MQAAAFGIVALTPCGYDGAGVVQFQPVFVGSGGAAYFVGYAACHGGPASEHEVFVGAEQPVHIEDKLQECRLSRLEQCAAFSSGFIDALEQVI